MKHPLLFSLLLLLICSQHLNAQTAGDYRSNAVAGAWSANSTWQRYDGSSWVAATDYPGQNSGTGEVTIQNGHTITLDVSPANAIGSLTIATGNSTNSLLTTSSVTLNVTGNVLIDASTGNAKPKFIVVGNASQLNCASITMNEGNNDNRQSYLFIVGGTVTVSGNITMQADPDRTFINFNTGTLNIAGSITGGNINPGTGTVNFNFSGAADQTIPVYNYYNLIFSGGFPSRSKFIAGNLNISGDLTSNGAMLHLGAFSITLANGKNCIINGNSKIILDGTGTIVTSNGNNTLTMVAGNAVLELNSATAQIPNFSSYSIFPYSLIDWNCNCNQNVDMLGQNWGKVSFSGSNTTKTLLSDVNTTTLSINTNVTLAAGSRTITIKPDGFGFGGSLTLAGPLTGTSKLIVSPAADFSVASSGLSPFVFYDLEINFSGNHTFTLNKDIEVANTLTLTNGKINSGIHTLTLTNTTEANQISGGGAASYVYSTGAGRLRRNGLSGTSDLRFPVGSSNHYLPVNINPVGGTADFAINVYEGVTTDGVQGGPALADKTNIVNACWNVDRPTGTGTMGVQFNWVNALEGSGFSGFSNNQIRTARYSGGWEAFGASSAGGKVADAANNSVTDFFSNFSPFIVGGNPTFGAGIPGANLWLKANAGVTQSGGTVSNWTDQTGINTFTLQTTILNTGPGYLTNAVNFNPAVTFNNTNTATVNAPVRLVGNTEISYTDGFAVFRKTNNASGALIGSTTAATNYGKAIFAGYSGNDCWVSTGIGFQYQHFTNAGLTSGLSLVNMDVSLTALPHATATYNGASQSVLDGGVGDYSSILLTPMIGSTYNIGGNQASSGWAGFRGEVTEMILFPTSLPVADKLKVQSYLAVKYGITLDPTVINYVNSSGTSIWNATGYWNDVFGIGSDDVSGLNQVSSNSMNTGSGDGTGQSGKGNITITNPASLDIGDFLLIGHDNGALTEQGTDLPAIISLPGFKRLGREWKVKHTGDVGTFDLTMNLSGITVTGANIFDFGIIVDTDGDGDFTTGTPLRIPADDYTNNIITFNGLSLPDNAVFAFVTNTIGSILPLKLTSFEASMNNCDATVTWSTANESNVKGFELQRSTGSSNWTTVATLPATGNGLSQAQSYRTQLGTSHATTLLRLKMVDVDGKASYSKVIAVSCGGAKTLWVYPNPATSAVVINGTKAGQQLRLVDLGGKTLQQIIGTENITNISVSQLPAGTYLLLSQQNGKWQEVSRIQKQ